MWGAFIFTFIAKLFALVIILYDTPQSRLNLYPLSLTRPLADLHAGMLTLRNWWNLALGMEVYCVSENAFSETIPSSENFLCIDATVIADDDCLHQVIGLKTGEAIEDEIGLIAYVSSKPPVYQQLPLWTLATLKCPRQFRLQHPVDLVAINQEMLVRQFALVTQGKTSTAIAPTNTIIGDHFFAEDLVSMEASIVNCKEGPVYIGKNALIMEGVTIRGPVYIGEGAVLKMGARIYPGSSIGEFCVAGGEIKNSILMSYSNKAHDGYLGDSIIGSWCNLGAGTTNSNVKNNASSVKIWNQGLGDWWEAGLKCGTIMGDFSRTAINTSLNTGTVVGVCCSIHDAAFPPKHVPSFTWGNGEVYELQKALRDIGNWKRLKQKTLTDSEASLLTDVYNQQHS